MEFKALRDAVSKQFAMMQKHQLFRVELTKDELNEVYLSSFPEGSNPMYRERTEHDCSCCRSFLGAVGNAVAIIDGKVVSIWDIGTVKDEPEYTIVAKALSDVVHSRKIANVFYHFEQNAGVARSIESLIDGKTKAWDHFHTTIASKFILPSADQPSIMAGPRTDREVFERSLKEISDEAVEVALELIHTDSIYRGAEHLYAVTKFNEFRERAKGLSDLELNLMTWQAVTAGDVKGDVFRIKNHAIGTLLNDLTKGEELEDAVKKFEVVMAGENYKRPKPLITEKMIKDAQAKVAGLGLTSALQRRYAKMDDITINNVLFADRSAKKAMSGGDMFDDLMATASKTPKDFSKVEEISIDKFLKDVLPRATGLEVLLEGRHQANMMSLIAPVDPSAGKLFKWGNNFTWSYKGGLADSEMRRAVAARGGNVDGVIRFSHSWNHEGHRNTSLMDAHVFLPGWKGESVARGHVHNEFGNTQRVGWNHMHHSKSGGVQDVDRTDAAKLGDVPVENISFADLARMPDGKYIYAIHNWQFRNPTTGGGRAEIEFGGNIYEYEFTVLKHKEWTTIAEVTLKNGQFSIEHKEKLTGGSSMTMWGLQSNEFHKVNIAMLSPNYWDENADKEEPGFLTAGAFEEGRAGIGNKHYFFMLDGMKNEDSPRGFSNEFLSEALTPHRKVFEVLGGKMKLEETDDQLTGLGFSSTKRDSLVVRVTGATKRVLRIKI